MKIPPLFSLLAAACAVASGASSLRATIALGSPFTDHAVLQRDKKVPVWGTGAPGEAVTVSFHGQQQRASASADGKWMVWLDPMPVVAVGGELTVKGTNTIALKDIVVGDVWLASGQSNMTFRVERDETAKESIAAANFPLIRSFDATQTTADAPATAVKGAWKVCSPATAGKFSAVGFFFVRELHEKLGIPLGLVHSAWGGTPIEAWMSAPSLKGDSAWPAIQERWQADLAARPANQAAYDAVLEKWKTAEATAKAQGEPQHQAYLKAHPVPTIPANIRPSSAPSVLFNGMINPLLPYALRGTIWYQGESNVGHAEEYHSLFSAMITDWRARFGQGDLPFYWVSLANYRGGSDGASARLREAQTQTLALPATGQALAIDIGNPDDIHPLNKHEVGHRLALVAEAKTYGLPVECVGPSFAKLTPEGTSVRVKFDHAKGGLQARGDLVAFEVAGRDRKFYPATAKIDGDTVIVSAPEVKAPLAVRYAFANSPVATLYNRDGLPAVPFRSEAW